MKSPAARGAVGTTLWGSSAVPILRNVRLLIQAAVQLAADDPILLAIQASRRIPFKARLSLGRALELTTPAFPAMGALGSIMTGHPAAGENAIVASGYAAARRRPRLASEVAILLGRLDLVSPSAPASTRARASWSRGDLSGAVNILDAAGAAGSRFARRLRSELLLLQPGHRLSASERIPGTPPISAGTADEPLRVLHVLTNSLPHTQSGYSLRSHRILTALRDQGVDSVALTRTGYPVMVGVPSARDEDIVDGIRYVRSLPAVLPQTQQERLEVEVDRALQLVEEFGPHLLHATTNYLNAVVAQEVSARTGLPWVFEVRGLMEKTWVASHPSNEGRACAANSERHRLIVAREGELARAADAVVTLSQTMAEELERRGVDGDAITLMPNGVEESLFQDHVSTERAREIVGLGELPGFGRDAFLVGAVSALVDYEGFDILLHAVAQMMGDEDTPADLRDRLRVVIAGEGVSRPALLALAEELGIQDRVHLPGKVPRGDARRWVEALDLVVVPRRDTDVTRKVTPQKPVEALALGKPLIVSDLPALREVVSAPSGDPVAICVPPGDPAALAKAIVLASNPAILADRMDVDGSVVARSRSWPEQVRRYRGLYERVTRRSEGDADSG